MSDVQSAPDHQLVAGPITPWTLLARAQERGGSIEELEKFMDLAERYEARLARRAFDAAIAEARGEIKPVIKTRRVSHETKTSDKKKEYSHEDLAGIADAVDPILARHGLSYRFRTSSPVNEPVSVTCILSHRDGHSEENTLIGPRDDTGQKNPLQAIGSTVTYLSRYTLKAALGLPAAHDDDGQAAGVAQVITTEQVEELRLKIVRTNTDIRKFLDRFVVERLEELTPAQAERANIILDQRAQEAQQ